MRLLLANDGVADPGGVDTYLRAVVPALRSRGHDVAGLHYQRAAGARPFAEPAFGVLDLGLERAIDAVAAWQPDVCFSHNMHALEIDAALARRWPLVKMMHGYFGTCVSGHKAHAWPARVPCAKRFGPACLAHFFPRRCGTADPLRMWRQYGWARRQHTLIDDYAAIVVASEHMRREYAANGVSLERLHALPLFAPGEVAARPVRHDEDRVLFLGRMTDLKGGDILVRAIAHAVRALSRPIAVTFAGEGPARRAWEAEARRLNVAAEFAGWLTPAGRDEALSRATALAIPSVWPEPFGLVGLEAAARGVPSIAFDTGGVSEWLRDGVNGLMVRPAGDARALAEAIARLLADRTLHSGLAAGALESARTMRLDRHVNALVTGVLEPAARRPVSV